MVFRDICKIASDIMSQKLNEKFPSLLFWCCLCYRTELSQRVHLIPLSKCQFFTMFLGYCFREARISLLQRCDKGMDFWWKWQLCKYQNYVKCWLWQSLELLKLSVPFPVKENTCLNVLVNISTLRCFYLLDLTTFEL